MVVVEKDILIQWCCSSITTKGCRWTNESFKYQQIGFELDFYSKDDIVLLQESTMASSLLIRLSTLVVSISSWSLLDLKWIFNAEQLLMQTDDGFLRKHLNLHFLVLPFQLVRPNHCCQWPWLLQQWLLLCHYSFKVDSVMVVCIQFVWKLFCY